MIAMRVVAQRYVLVLELQYEEQGVELVYHGR